MARDREESVAGQGLGAALTALRKQYGKKPLFVPATRRYIPMRHRALGELLSGPVHPGLPTGVYIELLGMQHSGKTTTTFAMIDAVLNQPADAKHDVLTDEGVVRLPAPRKVAYMAFEPVDADYLRASVRGVELAVADETGRVLNAKTANVFVHEPDTLEEGAEIFLRLIESGEIGLGIIDSVPAMLPEEERQKRMDESTMALLARQLGKFFRKSAHIIRKFNTTVVLVNQWRDKPGVSFGDPRVAPGGKAAGYFEAIRLDVSGSHRTPWFEYGKIANIKTSKNKVTGIQKATASYHLERGHGLSAEVELTEALVRAAVAEVSPQGRVKVSYSVGGKPKQAAYPNRAAWLTYLRENPAVFDKLWRICESKGVGPIVASGARASASGWED